MHHCDHVFARSSSQQTTTLDGLDAGMVASTQIAIELSNWWPSASWLYDYRNAHERLTDMFAASEHAPWVQALTVSSNAFPCIWLLSFVHRRARERAYNEPFVCEDDVIYVAVG